MPAHTDEFDRLALTRALGSDLGRLEERILRANAADKLIDFMELLWPVLHPDTVNKPFIRGWPLEAICDHLEGVHHGHIKRLLINVPPGFSKSLATSVFLPAWEWGPRNRADLQYVCAAYSDFLTLRDNEKCRALMGSPIYQKLWGDRVQFDPNNDARVKFMNTRRGFKVATSVGGVSTGERGDRLVCDDPHNVQTVESDLIRASAVRWFLEAWASRTNNQHAAFIVIMQRVHEEDVAAACIELGYTHLCIPMRFEVDHPHRWFGGGYLAKETADDRVSSAPQFGKGDPRQEDGELAFPALFPAERVDEQEKQMSRDDPEYAVAGQMQQRPTTRGGARIQEQHFIEIGEHEVPEGGSAVMCGWDLAGSDEARSPWTVKMKGKIGPDGMLYLMDRFKERLDSEALDEAILKQVERDGRKVKHSFPQDPGQAGKYQKRALGKKLNGYWFAFSPENKDKESRANPVISLFQAGLVRVVRGGWVADYKKWMKKFPSTRFKDDMDATSRLHMELVMSMDQKRRAGRAPIVKKVADPVAAMPEENFSPMR